MDVKRPLKEKIQRDLSDWVSNYCACCMFLTLLRSVAPCVQMVWDGTGTRAIEGFELMQTEQNWRKLFNEVFRGDREEHAGHKHIDAMCQMWKDYLKNEKEEFKKGRKLYTPVLEEGDPGYGEPVKVVAVDSEAQLSLIGGGDVAAKYLHGGEAPLEDDSHMQHDQPMMAHEHEHSDDGDSGSDDGDAIFAGFPAVENEIIGHHMAADQNGTDIDSEAEHENGSTHLQNEEQEEPLDHEHDQNHFDDTGGADGDVYFAGFPTDENGASVAKEEL